MEQIKEQLAEFFRDHPERAAGSGFIGWLMHSFAELLPAVFQFVVNAGAMAGAGAAIFGFWLTMAKWWREIGDPMLFRLRKRFNKE